MTARVIHGDCLDVLATVDECSVDAVVTDPPYDLTAGKKGGIGVASVNLDSPYGRSRIGTGNGAGGFMGKQWDGTGVAFDPATWAAVMRVMQPGGHLLAFGGTRTYHRMTCAIEDAGFEIRDCLVWLYGSGFPKSLDVGKAIDKAAGADRHVLAEGKPVKRMIPGADQNATGSWVKDNGREFVPTETAPATSEAQEWDGWGTALKPACEPIVVARKPLVGTVAANVQEHGTGALNIDACRIPANGESLDGGRISGDADGWDRPWKNDEEQRAETYQRKGDQVARAEQLGRWPANVILDPEAAALLDEQTGRLTSGKAAAGGHRRNTDKHRNTYGSFPGHEVESAVLYGDSGGASRFFYCAKPDPSERAGNTHPTVKPVELVRWLVRLVTRPGGMVLDPFAGSGTTGVACRIEGFDCLLIEREAEYVDIIEARLAQPVQPVMDFGGAV